MTAIEARIECLPTDVLVNICRAMMYDFRDEADTVFAATMKELERRLPSAEFIAFCGELEAAV